MRSLIIFTYLTTGILTLSVISETQLLHWDSVKNAPTSLYYPIYKIISGFLILLAGFGIICGRIGAAIGLSCLLALFGWWAGITSDFQDHLGQALKVAQSMDFLSAGIRILSFQFLFVGILGYFAAIVLSFMLMTNLKLNQLKEFQ